MNVPNPRERGFVLVVTLWLLAIITIGATYFAERVTSSVVLARQSQQGTNALVEMSSTRAEILFRLATMQLSIYGLGTTPENAIALDSRPYAGSGQDLVRLQDSRGLINVNFVDQEVLRRLLGQLGVAAENRDAMLDTLNDYTDTDNLRRLNGAEEPEYRARGLAPPPNDWLVTPWQLQNIVGWREEAALWKDARLVAVVTTARVVGFNPNTAPREALAALPGSSLEIADNLIRLRAQNPLTSASQLSGIAGQSQLSSDSLIFFPGDNIRLTQESDKIPWALHYQISLTPLADLAPWRIEYYVKTGLTSSIQNANKPIPLPARAALPATPDQTF